MKITRRNFGKVVAGALTVAIMPFIPKMPEVKAEEKVEVSLPERDFECYYDPPQINIIEYKIGEVLKYQDLLDVPNCKKCMHYSKCDKPLKSQVEKTKRDWYRKRT